MNNKYIVRAEHPLLRPGLSIVTEASERYVQPIVEKLMEIIRAINESAEQKAKARKP